MATFTQGYVEPGVYFKQEDQFIPNVVTGNLITAIVGTGKLSKRHLYKPDGGISYDQNQGGYPVDLPTFDTGTLPVQITYHTADDPNTILIASLNGWHWEGPQLLGPPNDPNNPNIWDTSNVLVSVIYDVAKSLQSDYIKLVSSYQDAVYWFGDFSISGSNDNPTIDNSLALGAYVYFNNSPGANIQLLCVQTNRNPNPDSSLGVEAILAELESLNLYTIVFLKDFDSSSDLGDITKIKNHVENLSSITERKNRIALIGLKPNTDDPLNRKDSVDKYISIARALSSNRVALICPSTVSFTYTYQDQNGNSQTKTVTLGGSYLATAVASIITNNNYTAGEPLSGKSIAAFSDIYDQYLRSEKNQMAANGVLIIEKGLLGIYIRHALSTKVGNIVDAELKMIRLKDMLSVYTLLPLLESSFINQRNTPRTLIGIRAAVVTTLQNWIRTEDIVAYDNLNVVTNSNDPRQVDVSFRIRPTWDVDWIYVVFGITL